MAKIIAVAGKGGVGKTTLTGLMIQYLCENGKTPILAVDADANSNLNEVLGVEAPPTLGEIREEIERAGTALHSPWSIKCDHITIPYHYIRSVRE